MWDLIAEQSAFEAVKAVIAERSEKFGKPVLMQGDSHLLEVDRPAGMPDNLTRIVVQGSTNVRTSGRSSRSTRRILVSSPARRSSS